MSVSRAIEGSLYTRAVEGGYVSIPQAPLPLHHVGMEPRVSLNSSPFLIPHLLHLRKPVFLFVLCHLRKVFQRGTKTSSSLTQVTPPHLQTVIQVTPTHSQTLTQATLPHSQTVTQAKLPHSQTNPLMSKQYLFKLPLHISKV